MRASIPPAAVAELNAELRRRIDDLALVLLGAPNKVMSSKRELRFGSKGALCIWIAGPKRGGWADFSGDAKGGPIGLIRHARNCDFNAAVAWARGWLGGASNGEAAGHSPPPPPAVHTPTDDAADVERRAHMAHRFWQASVLVGSTVAERYLVEARKIPMPLVWPDQVRFHPGTRSLILPATTTDGVVHAVQMVRLTSSARVALREDGSKIKLTRGALAGVAVRLPGPAEGPLLLAEGPETGLSVWRATGHETWIALGSISRVAPPLRRVVIVCADDDPLYHPDPRKAAAARALVKAVRGWREGGVCVAVAAPTPQRRQDKSDFNDLLQASGRGAVCARIAAVLADYLAERRQYVAVNVIPPAIRDLLAARRKSFEIFAAAEAANADAGGWLDAAAVRAVCTAQRLRQERRNARLWRRRAA